MKIEPRAKKDVIANAEWVLDVRLEIAGERVGQPFEMRYADAFLGRDPEGTGHLVAQRLQQEALARKPKKGRGRR